MISTSKFEKSGGCAGAKIVSILLHIYLEKHIDKFVQICPRVTKFSKISLEKARTKYKPIKIDPFLSPETVEKNKWFTSFLWFSP